MHTCTLHTADRSVIYRHHDWFTIRRMEIYASEDRGLDLTFPDYVLRVTDIKRVVAHYYTPEHYDLAMMIETVP